jgi:hypothetical protein
MEFVEKVKGIAQRMSLSFGDFAVVFSPSTKEVAPKNHISR